jgi:hypothetical protein
VVEQMAVVTFVRVEGKGCGYDRFNLTSTSSAIGQRNIKAVTNDIMRPYGFGG